MPGEICIVQKSPYLYGVAYVQTSLGVTSIMEVQFLLLIFWVFFFFNPSPNTSVSCNQFCYWPLLSLYQCHDSSVIVAFLLRFRAFLPFADTMVLSQWCSFEIYISQHTRQ